MKRAGRNSIIFCATKSDQAKIEEIAAEMCTFEDDKETLRRQHGNRIRENVRTMLMDFKYGEDIAIAVLSAERYWELGGVSRATSDKNEGFTLMGTEVPLLSKLIFRSVWEDATSGVTKALEDLPVHCREGLEEVKSRLARAKHGQDEGSASIRLLPTRADWNVS